LGSSTISAHQRTQQRGKAQTMQMPHSVASLTILLESEGLLERSAQGRQVAYTGTTAAAAASRAAPTLGHE
jgi:hypothetical protein